MNSRIAQFIASLFLLLSGSAVYALAGLGNNSGQDELLDPETAFRTSAVMNAQRQLQVQINIAEGYYLYRSKLGLSAEAATIGEMTLPKGKSYHDEFFGDVEIYRGPLDIQAAISDYQDDGSGELAIEVRLQGCADAGVCYPPQKQALVVEIPAAAREEADVAPANSSAVSRISSPMVRGLGFDDETSEILDPNIAFTVSAGEVENGAVPISWKIEDDYFLYRHKYKVEVLDPQGVQLGTVEISPGKKKNDQFFGEVEIHRNSATAQVSLLDLGDADKVTLKVGYQGCADAGICYPPQYKELDVVVIPAVASPVVAGLVDSGGGSAGAGGADTGGSNFVKTAAEQPASKPMVAEQDRLAASLANGKSLTVIATFFGMGLLLTFTPCVLPMIPILSSIIVGSGEKTSTGRSFALSLVYVLAMALTYTLAGVAVGLTGENIQATLQHPLVLSAFALLFVVLAASMFGMFEIQMPAFVQNRLSNMSNNQKSGSFGGVAMMGFLSALIVGPCVTAPLVGALIYIGQTGDAVLGGAALFALSMGMGVPLLIIGTTFGKYLPKVGAWMDVTKAIFGFMLLGVAIWMLDRVIPGWATMLLFALLLITAGMYMGALDGTPVDARGWTRAVKGFGFASLVYGTLLMIGVATGNGTLFQPLRGLTPGTSGATVASSEHVAFRQVKGIPELDMALASARAENRPVILDFYADWCVSCKEMEAFTFTDEKVASRMNQAVLLQADVTVNDDADKALLKKYGIFGPPAIIFYDRSGAEQSGARVVGFMAAEKFANHLDAVL